MVRTNLKRKRPGPSRPKKRTKVGKIKLKKPIKLNKKIWKRNVYNIKNDSDIFLKTRKFRKTSKKAKRKIRKKFLAGYSPFLDNVTTQFQETSSTDTDSCRWIWRTNVTTEYIKKLWNLYPTEQGIIPNSTVGTSDNYYKSGNNELYIGAVTYEYEIMNPSNYDMYLDIYDIVCKRDTLNNCASNYFSNFNDATNLASENYQNPIAVINDGLFKQNFYNTITSSTQVVSVGTPADQALNDITVRPTQSYPFNMFYRIIKKHKLKLEPGATLTHRFTYKPRKLISRAGFFYTYKSSFPGGGTEELIGGLRQRGIAGLTSGCLFKYHGQISGSGATGSTKHAEVASLPGKLMFKETFKCKWYALDTKYTYIFNSHVNKYSNATPTDMEVVNSDSIKQMSNIDTSASNN